MNKYAIVVVCYNRPNSLQRLLDSLNRIIPPSEKLTLYLSIDNAKYKDTNNEKVKEIANKFYWKFGNKIVDIKEKNLGLKEHVLQCGNLTSKFENIIVLEDDLLVSPLIFEYSKQVIKYYEKDEKIAGFGLYLYPKNQYSNKLFLPLNDGSNVFFMQNPCSWGQIWTRNQWDKFYNWYLKNQYDNFYDENIPEKVCNWDKKSWLKWHIKYVIANDLYFVYPLISITTNFSEKGVHNLNSDFEYQSNLCFSNENINFKFISFKNSISVYDAYYENIKLNDMINYNDIVCSDYNDTKNLMTIQKKFRYLLSVKKLDYKIVKKYGLQMYPYEQNIINKIDGNDMYLYDLTIKQKNKFSKKKMHELLYSYRITYFSFIELISLNIWTIKNIFKRIIYKLKLLWRKK